MCRNMEMREYPSLIAYVQVPRYGTGTVLICVRALMSVSTS